ncbi:MAG: hypothetical protein A2504_09415 [Bdellovibrionales bacterium RIFOXYD12_FULL_39_22]|nr:MAG: hypothetical protein A2385_17135 [Bdellovibrionales bacterium RIFOXYB1_FULL_39_21]OFZ41042.1 MAG: hypothetical protein A2485_00060 [Bdellovibrionales bacterium RIFOXYC12_FULL_39_17]OFZ50255.1 MAG: hypothetical protein A2404_07375 [Bdellovibrionales bacterium RIFOXYC1_FULL_39_130]OFZ75056.1 MAG: hypothetical protein A2560_16070 [Bdellovibrionales bacterium RIFOXYD1_FULL_39_84]OFZ92302.1 MAG: hypothetical protein A2504_09415 [Bdellovibrionales bacterium RIFOXYD12_FULL_39_22]
MGIISHLCKCEVKFIIAGGVAVVLQGVERLTMDVDLALQMNKKNIGKFLQAMIDLHMVPRVPVSGDILLSSEKINLMIEQKGAIVFTFIDPRMPLKQVDVFLTPNLSYDSLDGFTESVKIGGKKIKILSKQKLIELKLQVDPMRDKDLQDIKNLQVLINEETKEKNKKR